MSVPAKGVTLVELLVVLVLIAIAASVVGLALGTAMHPAAAKSVRAEVNAARDSAIRVGQPLTLQIVGVDSGGAITVLPDGRVIADSALAIDRFTGDRHAAH